MKRIPQKVLLIVNPKAGREEAPAAADRLSRELERLGARTHLLYTEGKGDARDLARDLAGDYDLVVACGGDGTFSEVISGLMALESAPQVGFLPVGSTCDVARTFQLSANPVKAAQDMVQGIAYAIDIGQVGGSPPSLRQDLPPEVVPEDPRLLPGHFSYVASFGAFTEASYATRRQLKKVLGHFAYVLKGLQSLASIQTVQTSVLLDGVDYSGAYIFGGVVNSFSVGGMVKLDDVLFDDGYFEVLLVKPPHNLGQTAKLISLLLRQKTGDRIIRRRARDIQFSFPQPVSFTIDGEYGGCRTEWTIKNIPRALKLRVLKAPGKKTR